MVKGDVKSDIKHKFRKQESLQSVIINWFQKVPE